MMNMKRIVKLAGIGLTALISACSRAAERPVTKAIPDSTESVYSIKFRDMNGLETDMSPYKGKKILIVNTASKCGYTPQYKELQELYEKYGDKLVVLAFPCNQFGGQEPGSQEDIMEFCLKNYGVTFPVYAKLDVKGSGQAPLYKWLSSKEANGWNDQEPVWNFCKYLIDEQGRLIAYFPSKTRPLDEKIISHLK
jgi:glutathione peroxidase